MNIKTISSNDGVNFEKEKPEDTIKNYVNSKVREMAEKNFNLKIAVPLNNLKLIFDNYKQYYPLEWEEDCSLLADDIKNKNHIFDIDNIIILLRSAKLNLKSEHLDEYNILRNIVLENCQLEDNSVI